jgi:hypothetical protein
MSGGQNKSTFSLPALLIVLSGGLLVFVLSLFLQSKGFKQQYNYGEDVGQGSYSVSSVGFAGFYQVLDLAGPGASRLLLGEPHTPSDKTLYIVTGGYSLSPLMPDLLPRSDSRLTRLFILPKWSYEQDPENPQWIINQTLLSASYADLALAEITGRQEGTLRAPWPKSFESPAQFTAEPAAAGKQVQLIANGEITPLIYSDEGILFGCLETEHGRDYVLSDPDLANNMGLNRGQNPVFIGQLVKFIYQEGALSDPSLFLEPFFPYLAQDPSSYIPSMLKFPLIIVTILILLSGLFVIYAAWERFGGVPKEPDFADFGKSKLIDNSARLLARTGHLEAVLEGYLEMNLRAAGKILHAPKALNPAQYLQWLAAAAAARGSKDPKEIIEEVNKVKKTKAPANLLQWAQVIHHWKEELESGPKSGSLHRQ